MFTGIVEELGRVRAVERLADGVRLTVAGATVTADAAPGDSIAVNGCCLTVSGLDGEAFTADVMDMTLSKTVIGGLGEGDPVNLERACTPTTRLGGHILQGHVDTVAPLLRRTPSAAGEMRWELVEIGLPGEWGRYLVPQGSVAVDGVSLTVAELHERSFVVSLIPETLARTTLGSKPEGAEVNLEVDVLAKHVERLLAARPAEPADVEGAR